MRLSPQSADEEQHRRKSRFASLGAADTGPLRLSHAVFFERHLPAGINLPVVIQTFLTTKNVVLRLTRARTCNMYVHSFSTSLARLRLKGVGVLQNYLCRKVCFGVCM